MILVLVLIERIPDRKRQERVIIAEWMVLAYHACYLLCTPFARRLIGRTGGNGSRYEHLPGLRGRLASFWVQWTDERSLSRALMIRQE